MPKGKGKEGKLQKSGGKRSLPREEKFLDDESKQSSKGKSADAKKSVAKILYFEKDGEAKRRKSAKVNETGKEQSEWKKSERMAVRFSEDGDKVVFEVEGQATEFLDDSNLEDNASEMGSDSEDDMAVDVERDSRNNNASTAPNEPRPTMSDGRNVELFTDWSQGHCHGNMATRAESSTKNCRNEEEEGMQCFVDYIRSQGLVIMEDPRKQEQNKIGGKHGTWREDAGENKSVVTIYQNAVTRDNEIENTEDLEIRENTTGRIGQLAGKTMTSHKRDSSSSEDGMGMNSSGEIEGLQIDNLSVNTKGNSHRNNEVIKFIADAAKVAAVQGGSWLEEKEMRTREMSGGCLQNEARIATPPQFNRVEQMIREVELSKARIYDVQGKEMKQDNNLSVTYHSALLDEDYLLVGNYIDDVTHRKIGNGEYIYFAKLLPKDKIGSEEDHRMEMVNHGGMSFWVSVTDRETANITSYMKWEQAFRVFSNIYTAYHPTRGSELIQYNHIIHTASQSFAWQNVYRYDREFRLHMT